MSKVDVVDCAIELTPTVLEGGRLDTASDLQPLRDTSANATLTSIADDTAVQELPAVDGGWKAWRFVVSALVLEAMIWGYEFRSVQMASSCLSYSESPLVFALQLRYFPR